MPPRQSFSEKLIAWQRRAGRKDLPWQGSRDPYRIWLSEVMLQQTQVSAVIPYFERFLARFPDVAALAAASEEEVLERWSGLGYYARGRNLHAAARIIAKQGFPGDSSSIERLPGVGRSTAAAIAAFAFGERAAILDGNVRRVLARHAGIAGFPGDKKVEAKLWALAEQRLPAKHIETYTQALMDLGATVCVRTPRCEACPVAKTCVARKKRLTQKIPAPRPRKDLPVKQATWFVFVHKGEVLLERRPSSGLWGGLWTFPEREPQGITLSSRRELAPLEHGFTHFRLKIQPVLCQALRKPGRVDEPGGMWIDIEDAAGAAVPAPVRALLERIA
ncbi:MAG TPA: A/G-specific adenine glycosylase [Burkholderiales bacterium]|nr:A/G-specific adenine glycosylase [Burkholderiales bacterium]